MPLYEDYFVKPGVAGGQTAYGGTASGEHLTFGSTAHATKGLIKFGTSAYNEANHKLGIGTQDRNVGCWSFKK
jgi:hypothetical protein